MLKERKTEAIHYLVGLITLRELKRELVLETLSRYSFRGAAKALGITQKTLYNLRKAYASDPRSKMGGKR